MPSLYGYGLWGKSLYSQSVTVTGGLSVNQAPQTLNATGSVLSGIVGSLNLVQADQALVAAGSITGIAGGLVEMQADQTLAATGVVTQPPISATLVVTQDNQTLAAGGLILGWGPSAPCLPPVWVDSELCPPSLWTPVLPPNWELPGVTGAWGVGLYGAAVYQPSPSSPWLPSVSVNWEQCDG